MPTTTQTTPTTTPSKRYHENDGFNALAHRILYKMNWWRMENGLSPLRELPKGTPGRARECPLGRGTGKWMNMVNADKLFGEDGPRFVCLFDRRLYKNLIADDQ